MKTKILLVVILAILRFSISQGQELPPKHRGMHPTLQKDGKVLDEKGRQLGYITKDGKVCDVTGKTIGIIAETGEISTTNGKGIVGVMQKDGSFKSKNCYVVTSGGDGTLMAAGKVVGHVDEANKNKSHACATHCFFDEEYPEKEEVDRLINK